MIRVRLRVMLKLMVTGIVRFSVKGIRYIFIGEDENNLKIKVGVKVTLTFYLNFYLSLTLTLTSTWNQKQVPDLEPEPQIYRDSYPNFKEPYF